MGRFDGHSPFHAHGGHARASRMLVPRELVTSKRMPEGVVVLCLETTGIVRKYLGIMDFFLSVLRYGCVWVWRPRASSFANQENAVPLRPAPFSLSKPHLRPPARRALAAPILCWFWRMRAVRVESGARAHTHTYALATPPSFQPTGEHVVAG